MALSRPWHKLELARGQILIQLKNSVFSQRHLLSKTALVPGIQNKTFRILSERRSHNQLWAVRLDNSFFSSCYVLLAQRKFSTCVVFQSNDSPLKPSSKVEESVICIKEKTKEKLIESSLVSSPENKLIQNKQKKESLWVRIKKELKHIGHGFKLLGVDVKVGSKLLLHKMKGNTLTRRESKLLTRIVGDVLRMIPFSLFIVVPFLEFTLPFFLILFPGMLPSTFESRSAKESKIKKRLKTNLEVTKFFQKALDEMALSSKSRMSAGAKEFSDFFQKVRSSGQHATSEEIMKFAQVFEDELTLDRLSLKQLKALCTSLGISTLGTSKFLRYQLRLKMRSILADDKLIQKEKLNSLNFNELQVASQARGMPAFGIPEDVLRSQMAQWLHLSLEKKVPLVLLLLSQSLMFPETMPPEEKLAATIQTLPHHVETGVKNAIGDREGVVDYEIKICHVEQEMELIQQERKECSSEELIDKAPTLKGKIYQNLKRIIHSPKKPGIKESEIIGANDIAILSAALEKNMKLERGSLNELRKEMIEYEEHINELKSILPIAPKSGDMKETTGAKFLSKKVNKMIANLDNLLQKLGEEEQKLMAQPKTKDSEECLDIVKISDILDAVKNVPGSSGSVERITHLLNKLDSDKDGNLRVDCILKMVNLLNEEEMGFNKKIINDLIDLIEKEEAITLECQIVKALRKEGIQDLKKEVEQKRAEIFERQEKKKRENLLKAEKLAKENKANSESASVKCAEEKKKKGFDPKEPS